VSSRYDSLVSAEAWERLVDGYRRLDPSDDFAVAELVRLIVGEVEGE